VHSEPADIVAAQLAFANVQSGTDLDPKPRDGVPDRFGAAHATRRTVEQGQHAVAGGLDPTATRALDLADANFVVLVEQLPPARVARVRRAPRLIDDVREQNRAEDPVLVDVVAAAGNELLDRVEHPLGVAKPGQMIISGLLQELRVRMCSAA
jgi:hypothetical protein